MSTVTFADAGVTNDTGIDITQGMIDNVANPFLDLNAIVTQFKFKDASVTVKIPAGTTVKYGEDQCTLLEDVTATLTPNSSEDCHATTTSGTVLSGTTLDSGQLITSSGQWSVVLNSSVKVKTQDGYAILGTTDLDELSGGTTVSLSGGTNVCAVGEIIIDEKTKKTSQFYFLADVTYHQIVLQELYDTLEDLQNYASKEQLLNYLKSNCMGSDRNDLSESEYNELKNKPLMEIIEHLSELGWLTESDLSGMTTLDRLVQFVKDNQYNFVPEDIISIYASHGAFSDAEIQNLRAGKSLNGASTVSWTVDGLLDLVDDKAFSDVEIDAIRTQAAQEFLKSLKFVANITINDILRSLEGLYTYSDEAYLNTIGDDLAAVVGTDDFKLNDFDKFLKNLINITMSTEEIYGLPEFTDGAACVRLSQAANTFFDELSENSDITSEYLGNVFGSGTTLQSLKNEVLAGTKTIQGIYDLISQKRSTDTKYQAKDDNGNYKEAWPPVGVNTPNNADSLRLTSDAENYFLKLERHTQGDDPLITLDDLQTTCSNLGVTQGNTIDACITNLQKAVIALNCTPTKINNTLDDIVIEQWKISTSHISENNSIINHIIENGQISLSELKKAVKNTGVYSKSTIANLRTSIENANSKTEIFEILSQNELENSINVGDLVAGLTTVHKYDSNLCADELVNAISNQGKLTGQTLSNYQNISSDLNRDGTVQKLATDKILESLKQEDRINYDGFRNGLLNLHRFTKTTIDAALAYKNPDLVSSDDYIDCMNKLLNLCMLAGTPTDGRSSYILATGVQRTVDSNGNYVYKIVGSGSIGSDAVGASFSKEDATTGMAVAYFALAIMYEKTCIQQMILVEQLKQIEKINDEIRENNKALKALTELYDKIYAAATWSAKYSEVQKYPNLSYSVALEKSEMSIGDLHEYLSETVKNGSGLGDNGTVADFHHVNAESYRVDGNQFITVVGRYDRDGNNMWSKYTDVENGEKDAEEDFDSNTSNIDVKEQATLTHISNLQDQVRMYGDSLSTDAQLMTTKMEQYMQDANACVSACTQTVKSIGDYWKNIITNIR